MKKRAKTAKKYTGKVKSKNDPRALKGHPHNTAKVNLTLKKNITPALRASYAKKKELLERSIIIASLLGTGLAQRAIAIEVGVSQAEVSDIQQRLRHTTPRGELLRRYAVEAREKIQSKAMEVLHRAVDKINRQVTKGVKVKGKYVEPPLAHVAQAARAVGEIALHEAKPNEEPTTPDAYAQTKITMDAKSMGELLMQVRDHEQARGRKEVEIPQRRLANGQVVEAVVQAGVEAGRTGEAELGTPAAAHTSVQ